MRHYFLVQKWRFIKNIARNTQTADKPLIVRMHPSQMQHTPVSPIQAEFKGRLSRSLAASNGSDFALVMSMLHHDVTQRFNITPSAAPEVQDSRDVELASVDFYPKTPLVVEPQHWQQYTHVAQAAARQDNATIKLMQSMFPAPLAQNNDPLLIPDEVLANCDIFCQQRMQSKLIEDIEEDNTLLAEVIPQAEEQLRDATFENLSL